MKQLIVLGGYFIICVLLSACNNSTNKTQAVATPEAVINAFSAKYPAGTDVKWETENKNDTTFYEADFKMSGKKVEAEFDENGNFLKEK